MHSPLINGETVRMSAPSTTDKDTARIDAALDALLAEFDPKKVDNITFRGARFDR